MNISHYEIEVIVRCIDARNKPINQANCFKISDDFKLVFDWLGKHVDMPLAVKFSQLAADAIKKPDENIQPDSNPQLPRPEAKSEGVDSGVQPTLFREGS
jgi:hypothetical protein